MLLLGIKTSAELHELPFDELSSWMKFFDQRPVGWREDFRFAQLMRTFGDKRKPTEMFSSIKTISEESENIGMNLRNSFIFHKMLSAKGGDKLDLLEEL
jgi:hypothetical protein